MIAICSGGSVTISNCSTAVYWVNGVAGEIQNGGTCLNASGTGLTLGGCSNPTRWFWTSDGILATSEGKVLGGFAGTPTLSQYDNLDTSTPAQSNGVVIPSHRWVYAFVLTAPLASQSSQFSDAHGWNQARSYFGSLRLADVNGDGKLDVCGRSGGGIACALNNGFGAFSFATDWLTTDMSNAAGWLPNQYGSTTMFADINGDGRADVCGRGVSGVVCAHSTGNSFGPTSVRTSGSQFSDAHGWNVSETYFGTLRLADVNGDGRPDLCGRSSGGIVCALNNGSGSFGLAYDWTSDFSNVAGWNAPEYATSLQFGDIDGDGKADVCGRGTSSVACALSTGGSFRPSYLWTRTGRFSNLEGWNWQPSYYRSLRLADMDGDGKADLCGRSASGIECAKSSGTTFGSNNLLVTEFTNAGGWLPEVYGTTMMLGDINGDAKVDVCGRGISGIQCATQ
jgi:hypothetical protein